MCSLSVTKALSSLTSEKAHLWYDVKLQAINQFREGRFYVIFTDSLIILIVLKEVNVCN